MRHNMEVDYSAKGKYSARLFTRKAVQMIHQHDPEKQPLFLYLSHQVPHIPYQAPEESIDKFKHIKDGRSRKKLASKMLLI